MRWVPRVLLGGLSLLIVAAAVIASTRPAGTASNPDSSTLQAVYSLTWFKDVEWTGLAYPGLQCHSVAQGNVEAPGALVVELTMGVPVQGRSKPLALVSISCNLNHTYANLYVFAPGRNPARSVLVQRLGLFQGKDQLAHLTTSKNHVTATLAGYGSLFKGECCPNVISIHRWVWQRSHFVALRPSLVTNIVMPSLVGMSLGHSESVLERLGIVWLDVTGGTDSKNSSVVIWQSPGPGVILHPPSFQVSVRMD
jgi:hypothetical protein